MSAPAKVFLVWGVRYEDNGDEEYTLLEVHATREGAEATMDRQPDEGEYVEIDGVDYDSLEGPDERAVIA